MFVVLSHQVFATLLWQPQKMNTSGKLWAFVEGENEEAKKETLVGGRGLPSGSLGVLGI